MSSRLIVQFAKAPIEGLVKTRMQPHLTASEARILHEFLVVHCCKSLLSSQLAEVQLWVDSRPEHALFESCLDIGVDKIEVQRGADLGERMFDCFTKTLRRHHSVVLVGSDCPEIETAYLTEAFNALESVPLVFGPALDGGYVLLGAREISKELFQGIDWGQNTVFRETQEAANRLGMKTKSLAVLRDLDRPEDLAYYSHLKFTRH